MDVLQVKNLTKRFSKFVAVDNISFSLREGEILGLLGPNGAGKTTTIDMLLGLTKPTAGKIIIFGLPFEQNRIQILKQMNFSAAYTHLPWRLKVRENLYTFARLYEVEDFRNVVDKLLTEFKIYDFKEKLIEQLSSGQMSRVNLCKAFINKPRLLLMDEPTAFLDPDIADYLRKKILAWVRKEKTSILFTSHNMSEVTELCDRVIFLNKGKIIAIDTPTELANKIKFCKVRLFFAVKLESVKMLLTNYKYRFSEKGKEMIIETEEEKVGQLLGRLSLAKFKYSQITIEKPTLEDFFISVARKKL